jgi:hypothetical protein
VCNPTPSSVVGLEIVVCLDWVFVHFKNLPQIAKTITELEKQIKK